MRFGERLKPKNIGLKNNKVIRSSEDMGFVEDWEKKKKERFQSMELRDQFIENMNESIRMGKYQRCRCCCCEGGEHEND